MKELTPTEFEAALQDVPVFPLPDVVLFPKVRLPLHIFEPRYRAMIADALSGSRLIAVAMLHPTAKPNAEGNPSFLPVAGVGQIIEHESLPDGRSNIVLLGRGRVRLEELPFRPPYRRAQAVLLRESRSGLSQADRTALVTTAAAFAGEVSKRNRRFSFALSPDEDTGVLADACAQQLLASSTARQAALEELSAVIRTRTVIREIALQHASISNEGGGALN